MRQSNLAVLTTALGVAVAVAQPPTREIPPGAATTPTPVSARDVPTFRETQAAEETAPPKRATQTKPFDTLVLDAPRLTVLARDAYDARVEKTQFACWSGFVAPADFENLANRRVVIDAAMARPPKPPVACERRPIDTEAFNIAAFTPATATKLVQGRFDVTFKWASKMGASAGGFGPPAEVAKLRAAGILTDRLVTSVATGVGKSGAPPSTNLKFPPPIRRPDRTLKDGPVPVKNADVPVFQEKKAPK